jgi:hypothetical protein
MSSTDLPPLPFAPIVDPEVCDLVSLYLAVSHDLTDEQKRRVTAHLQICQKCVHEYHLVRQAARLVSSLEETEPSPRVDVAVMAAIAARTATTNGSPNALQPLRIAAYNKNSGPRRRSRIPIGGLVAAAAVLIVACVGLLHSTLIPSAFQVPASAWNGVLYHTQTVVDNDGAQYHVTTYHDMATDKMNVETTINGKLDVMVVSDGQNTVVGMDMMHDVTQNNASAWLTDDSMFDVKRLNANLQAGLAKYLGKSQFDGQTVYEIRDDNGDIILLNMQYKPINVLQPINGSSTGKPMYDKVQMLNSAPAGTWDTTPPSNFKQGQLPTKP